MPYLLSSHRTEPCSETRVTRESLPRAHPRIRGAAGPFGSGLGLIGTFAILLLAPALAAAQGAPDVAGPKEQSFLTIVLESAGWIGVVIVCLSLIAVTVIIEHFWTIRRVTMAPEAEILANRELIEQRRFKECVDQVAGSKTMFGDVLTVGLRHGRHGFEAMLEAVEERASAWRSRLFRKVEYLNIIGNISPLLGLLGTVMGMIQAFAKMRGGAYGPEELAGAISLALVSTFMGLIVAIISLGFFGICRNRVDSFTVAAHASVVDLIEYFRPAVAAEQSSGAAAVPRQTVAVQSS
ncbi:MAG: MotA/TolQ/ExbB proton channel family protein [Phycisphaerae bacterium]